MSELAQRIRARRLHDTVAISGAINLTWRTVIRDAEGIARQLRDDDLVMISGPTTTATYVAITACLLSQIPFFVRNDALEVPYVMNRIQARLRPTVELQARDVDIVVDRISDCGWPMASDQPQLRYLGLTSGSSGPVRVAFLPAAGHDFFLKSGATALGLDESSVFADPASSSDLSLTNFFLALYSGSTWLPLLRLIDRVRVLDAFRREAATHWRSVPVWASTVFGQVAKNIDPLPSMQTVGFGGEILTNAGARAAAKLFPAARIVNTYGATEMNGFSSSHTVHVVENPTLMHEPCPIGSPFDGWSYSVEALNVGGSQLVVRSPYLASGLLEVGEHAWPELTFLNGIFKPGDAAHLTHDGLPVVTGRVDRRFNHRGYLVSPEPLEKRIFTALGVDCCLVQSEADLVVLVEHSDRDRLEEEDAIRAAIPRRLSPVRVKRVEAIPRLPSTKVDYLAARTIAR